MKATYWITAILLVLDIGIVVLCGQLDKRLYCKLRQPLSGGHFFLNNVYEERVNRFLFSKGGMVILSLVFIATILLTRFTHGAF